MGRPLTSPEPARLRDWWPAHWAPRSSRFTSPATRSRLSHCGTADLSFSARSPGRYLDRGFYDGDRRASLRHLYALCPPYGAHDKSIKPHRTLLLLEAIIMWLILHMRIALQPRIPKRAALETTGSRPCCGQQPARPLRRCFQVWENGRYSRG